MVFDAAAYGGFFMRDFLACKAFKEQSWQFHRLNKVLQFDSDVPHKPHSIL